jgi:hypothetical protein
MKLPVIHDRNLRHERHQLYLDSIADRIHHRRWLHRHNLNSRFRRCVPAYQLV